MKDGGSNHLDDLLPEVVPRLPLETRWPSFPLRQYGGFWLPEVTLQVGVPTLSKLFKPRPTDVFLACVPKSGTTWLKALTFATLNRGTYCPFESKGLHPLHHSNPHDCIPFFEFELAVRSGPGFLHELEALPSPRILATHLPYSLLPDSIKDESCGCRIVYISRDPKDVLVSSWMFFKKVAVDRGVIDKDSFDFEEAFELFCEGRLHGGPQWHHILEYWDESVRRPEKVLFLKYEEMLLDPKTNLRKLAEFMGCGFSEQEDEEGVVDAIVGLCSLGTLKNMEVNRDGRTRLNIKNENYFRNGVAGDWSNYMTPEMAQRLDNIIGDALQGSGFSFSSSI